ncbi:type VII secretion protein EccB [Streptomyces sp. NBC_01092]|uniref:type VII secretion protein EccB n=1 Tax=Streptomyces sp. NBC_01092 TaxID=2903748 RepID=UPI003866F509|nr:type VII secretion protein EccB [Streptomyces sp. NBC_01092]
MQSKRDQVQAHVFLMGRLTSGMLLADPDAPDSPLGRTTRGTVFGVIIGVVVAAGAFVFGLINPGGHELSPNTLIINKDTGARYLYVDGRLRPVRNYASALLLGGDGLKSDAVHTSSLRGKPLGSPVGIPGAPDSVPGKDDLETGAWQVCSVVNESYSTALIAGAPADGDRLGADEGLVVVGPDMNTTYLVWQGQRLRLDEDEETAASLGYGSVTPRPVSAAFLQALVPGPDLTPPDVPGRGDDGPDLGSHASKVGQVFQVQVPGSAPKYYLLKREGLVPLTVTQAALVLGDPATREEAYEGVSPEPVELGAVALKDHQAAGDGGRDMATGLPKAPPRAVDVPDGQSACARVQPGSGAPRVTSEVVPVASLTPVAKADPTLVDGSCIQVDRLIVRPGRGVLVQALSAGGKAVGDTTYFVSDNGVKYRVRSGQALQALGYADAKAQPLPSPLLSMLPSGPDLDVKAAALGEGATTAGCLRSGDYA